MVVTAEAEDAGSPLKSCEWTVDAGPWTPAAAEDGITDSMKERFVARIEGLSISEHLIVIRAVDSAGNAGLAKVVLR